ncbi:MAG: type II toxin-antitoxin system HipA family toxin [Nevskia sp.]|nr:type II toxin-antitoxin system HipA family toxin [Nevskia sp.]
MAESSVPVPAEHLVVWHEQLIVGRLWRAGRHQTLRFAYEMLASPPPHRAISQSLPLREDAYDGPEVEAFFGNLLPEGDIRTAVARRLQISERNDYALLDALGGDCAGALVLMPPGMPPPEVAPGGRVLNQPELASLVDALPTHPLLAGENGMRLSLAGAQPKLALCKAGDDWLQPAPGAISTHILKPAIRDLPGSIENEAFCMQLAAHCGLGVPESWTEYQPRLYVVARYDRERLPATGRIRRLHQEDFCQALGIPASRKYEAEGGPSLADCFGLIRRISSDPAGDLLRLTDWVIFNFFIGNHDAHAKNLSLLYRRGEVRLAPFYDLLSTAAYPSLSDRFAMRIGGAESVRYMAMRHWRTFTADCGLTFSFFQSRATALIRKLSFDRALEALQLEPGAAAPVLDVIASRLRAYTNMVRAENPQQSLPLDEAVQPEGPKPT